MPLDSTNIFHLIGIGAFLIAWCVGVLAWVIGLAEMIAVLMMIPWAFKLGKTVIAFREPLSSRRMWRTGETFETENLKAALISNKELLFRQASKLVWFRVHTPFPLKGRLLCQNGIVEVEGRVPVGSSLFFVAWLVGWTVGGILVMSAKPWLGVGFLILGWSFAAFLVLPSIKLEKKRFLDAYSELKEMFL